MQQEPFDQRRGYGREQQYHEQYGSEPSYMPYFHHSLSYSPSTYNPYIEPQFHRTPTSSLPQWNPPAYWSIHCVYCGCKFHDIQDCYHRMEDERIAWERSQQENDAYYHMPPTPIAFEPQASNDSDLQEIRDLITTLNQTIGGNKETWTGKCEQTNEMVDV